MTLLGRRLAVSLPDTVLEEKDSPRDKTVKVGQIARACAIYGVDLVEIYSEKKKGKDAEFLVTVLRYLETPQYLRKRLYPIDESLRYAGLLPPLRISSHKPKVPAENLTVGEVREGVTNSDGSVEIGLDKRPRLKVREAPDKRVSVRVVSKEPFVVEQVDRTMMSDYWGYVVEEKEAGEVFSDDRFGPRIATSRLGGRLSEQEEGLKKALADSKAVKLVFGSPSKGLFDIFGPELSKKADLVVNVFPEQHVESVRTEEAMIAALAIVSVLSI